jgi:hypothetical protein
MAPLDRAHRVVFGTELPEVKLKNPENSGFFRWKSGKIF